MLECGGEALEEGFEESVVGLVGEAERLQSYGWECVKCFAVLASVGCYIEGEGDKGEGGKITRDRRCGTVGVFDVPSTDEAKVKHVRIAKTNVSSISQCQKQKVTHFTKSGKNTERVVCVTVLPQGVTEDNGSFRRERCERRGTTRRKSMFPE